MKLNSIKATALIGAFLFSVKLFSQEVPEPEYVLRPYTLDASTNKLIPLDRTDIELEPNKRGVGGMHYSIYHPSSVLEISKKAMPRFIIKVEPGANPADKIVLATAKVKSEKRNFTLGTDLAAGKVEETEKSFVKLDFLKIREGVYEIKLPYEIPKGQYAFVPATASTERKIDCFGIVK